MIIWPKFGVEMYRELYINELLKHKEKKIIKVLTGIRRVGKSYILNEYCEKLKSFNVDDKHIIKINFEDMQYEELLDYKKLNNFIIEKLKDNNFYYLFFDEIQDVKNYEKVIDSLFLRDNVDIYITGSNAYLLSSELATYLTGRYIEINVLPYSFVEYKNEGVNSFQDYIFNGGMPYTMTYDKNDKDGINQYLNSVFNTILIKDIAKRSNIKNIINLEAIAKYLFDNIGNETVSTKMANYFASNGNKISQPTIDSYLNMFCESYLFYKADRFDIKGKQILKTQKKYYATDMGFRHMLLGNQRKDLGRVLENIVFFELKRRGYKVYVGELDDWEVDFYAERYGKIEYYQVTLSITDENVLEREIRPLKRIRDNNLKYIITNDNVYNFEDAGIHIVNIEKWLLGEEKIL